MIEITSLRAQLQSLPDRAAKRDETERWATNTLEGIPESIIPRVPPGARAALERLAKQCESIGPRILKTRAFGTIGDINWGGDGSFEADEYLRDLDLEALAGQFLQQGQIGGIMAGIVRRDPENLQQPVIEVLTGYVELVYRPGSNQQVIGLLQAWVETTQAGASASQKTTWSVRLYDVEARSMATWRGLNTPEEAAKREPTEPVVGPSAEYPAGAPVPRFVVLQKHPRTHQPLGEVQQLLPLIQSDWSSQLRGDRAEENTAFPQLKLVGKAQDGTEERSSAHVIRVEKGGDAGFIEPGDLSQLHTHHDRKLERLREDANMPGGFLGNQTPSGEALREANQKFISSCQYHAERLERLLNQLAQDYLAAVQLGGITAEISLQINREYTRAQEVEMIIQLFDKDLISFEAAVRAVSVFVPSWPDEEVEAYILGYQRPLTAAPPLPGRSLEQDRLLS